jgi:hypothetical protein
MRSTILGLSLAALLSAPAAAASFTIDFEALGSGTFVGESYSVTVGGVVVTFSGEGLQIRTGFGFFTGSGNAVLSTTSDSAAITVTFSVPVDQVSIYNPLNVELGGEIDVISGIASSASGVVDSFTSATGSPSLNGPGIVSVVFDDVPDGEGYVLDLLSFSIGGTPVPAPAALGLFGFGLLGLTALRRR